MEQVQEPLHIIKRDGSIRSFDPDKIVIAITKAGKATGEIGPEQARELTVREVMPRIRALKTLTPDIERVQDAVEKSIFAAGYFDTLRAYIVYREQHAKSRNAKHSWVDVESSINEYLNHLDWRVNANANQGYSLGGLCALYALTREEGLSGAASVSGALWYPASSPMYFGCFPSRLSISFSISAMGSTSLTLAGVIRTFTTMLCLLSTVRCSL